MNLQTLVLNADFRPVSAHPLSVWSWRDALTALLLDRVMLVANYDVFAHSPSFEIAVPSVVALKHYQDLTKYPAFTRYHIYLRDSWRCQYCAERFRPEQLTFDHVIPKSRGGRTTWENVVTACAPCNHRKGNRTPREARMALLRRPDRPTRAELVRRPPQYNHNQLHHTWIDYLYWDSELDE